MKKVIVDQVEVTRDGHLQIRMVKQIVDGDDTIDIGYHRTVIEVGGDVEAQMESVGAHLQAAGFPPVADAEIGQLKNLGVVAFTPEKIAQNESAKEAERIALTS